jgi:iron complex transport system permease protein
VAQLDTLDAVAQPMPHVGAEALPRQKRSVTAMRSVGLLVGAGVVVAAALLSLRYGSVSVTNSDAWNALFDYDPESYEQTLVRQLRMPRTIIAIVVGLGLGVTGAVMQGVTRNPLADPFILGVSGGAGLGITTAVYFGSFSDSSQYPWFAFAGAFGASALVYVIGSGGRGSPVRLVLAGVITGTLMSTWTAILIHTDIETREAVRHILIGSVNGRTVGEYWLPLTFVVVGAAACVLMGHQINVLNLGEDAARAAGMNTTRVRLICTFLTVVVAGAAVAAAGPIGFVGFAVPHMVRSITGPDYRWILPYSVLAGVVVLLGADMLGRFLLMPAELEASIVMGLVGAPFFIYLARRRSVSA